jgi:serine/threonine protein phosphatase PrpC
MEIIAQAATDIGRKKRSNEDSFLIDRKLNLYIVADGMGGHAAGEVASAQAIESTRQVIEDHLLNANQWPDDAPHREKIKKILGESVLKASKDIYQISSKELAKRGMGTTLSLLFLTDQRGFIAHVGDSRIYLIRNQEVFQLTEDHSLIRDLIKHKKITPEEAENSPYRNALTRAVGIYEHVEVDILDFEISKDDTFLLCSDGLTNYLKDANEIYEVLSAQNDFSKLPTEFINLANNRGGKDNITSLVVKISQTASDQPSSEIEDVAFRLNILRKMPIFQHLEYVELMEVLNVSVQKKFEHGELIFKEGEMGDQMFVILDGQVSILKGEQEISILSRGGHFGEMALMDRNVRSASAQALGVTRLISVQRKPLFELMQKNKEIAVKLLWCFMQVLNQRLRNTTEDLEKERRQDLSTAVLDTE